MCQAALCQPPSFYIIHTALFPVFRSSNKGAAVTSSEINPGAHGSAEGHRITEILLRAVMSGKVELRLRSQLRAYLPISHTCGRAAERSKAHTKPREKWHLQPF